MAAPTAAKVDHGAGAAATRPRSSARTAGHRHRQQRERLRRAGAPNPRRTAPIVELGPNVLTHRPALQRFQRAARRDDPGDFTEPVDVDGDWFNITCASSGPHNSATFASSFGGRDHYITPNDNFIAGEQCTVTILKDRIHDQDLDDSGPNTDTLPADYSWSFTVRHRDGAAVSGRACTRRWATPAPPAADPSNYLMEKPEFALSYNRDQAGRTG